MALPESTLPSFHAVGLPFDPDELRYGSTNTDRTFHERILARAILAGKNRLLQLGLRYLKSYLQTKTITVLHYRDLILSIALNKLTRCVQCKDAAYIELTEHSRRFWTSNVNAKDLIWPAIPEFNPKVPFEIEPGYYGVAGSLAFYFFKYEETGDRLYPLELLDKVLNLFWKEVKGLSITDIDVVSPLQQTARERHSILLAELQCLSFPFVSYQQALNKLWSTPMAQQPLGALDILKLAKRSLLVPSDWSDLKQRMILGEYSSAIIPLLSNFQSFINASPEARIFYEVSGYGNNFFEQMESSIQALAKPTGMPMVYQAFAIEGLYRVAKLITELPKEVHSLPLSEFLVKPAYETVRLELANYFALSYDAYAALGFFNTLVEADGLSYRAFVSSVSMLAENELSELSAESDWRLFEFI